jgi:arylsulfatase A
MNLFSSSLFVFARACLTLVVLLYGQTSLISAEQPNVVIFLADDLGYGDLGCFGNEVIKTPNLDGFAKQGIKLTECYAGSAVCSPSRSAILTGRTPHRNGVYTWIKEGSEVHLRTSETTFASILKNNGYATCHVGKWHLNGKFNSKEQPQPGEHGYEHWMATQNNAAPSHHNPDNFVRNGKSVGQLEGFSAPLIVDEAISWLKSGRDQKKPFLLSVWTHEPHLPIESDPQFMEMYKDHPEDFQQHHGNVSQLDFAFGKLLKTLDDMKLSENTFIFFTADNGPEGDGNKGRTRGSTGGLRGRKRSMYEGGIRVPGLARWPGHIKAGTVSGEPVIGSDLFPTVLKVTGSINPTDKVLDGTDILPILTGKTDKLVRNNPLYWRLGMAPAKENLFMAMRDGDFKILANLDFSHIELYNIKSDPGEKQDLTSLEPKILEAMKGKLVKLNREIEAEGPDWWKRLSPNGGGEIREINKK